MFAVGGYGLPPYFAMELSASSSWDNWKIWIANTGSQRLTYGHRFDGKETITLLLVLLTYFWYVFSTIVYVLSGTYPTIFIKTEKYYALHCVKKKIKFSQTFPVCQIWLPSTNSGCVCIPNLVINRLFACFSLEGNGY
jgi:hypothetical protein